MPPELPARCTVDWPIRSCVGVNDNNNAPAYVFQLAISRRESVGQRIRSLTLLSVRSSVICGEGQGGNRYAALCSCAASLTVFTSTPAWS